MVQDRKATMTKEFMKVRILLLIFALAVPAAAQNSAPQRTLEPLIPLEDLVVQALQRNPEILAAQKRFEAAKTRPAQESSLPDPMLSFGYRNI